MWPCAEQWRRRELTIIRGRRDTPRQALEGYRALLSSFEGETSVDAEPEQEDLRNDLSGALGILGSSLLSQGRYEEAARAYRRSLQHERGAAVGVNSRQVLHQIGNCESNLGNYGVAAKLYVEAAKIFHFIGMEEYLSNAFGELGYTLLDVDLGEIAKHLDENIIDHSLVDLSDHAERIFDSARPPEHNQCIEMNRKLFGMVVLLSVSGYGAKLGPFCAKMENEAMREFVQQIDAGIGSGRGGGSEELLLIALRLGVLVAECEKDFGGKWKNNAWHSGKDCADCLWSQRKGQGHHAVGGLGWDVPYSSSFTG